MRVKLTTSRATLRCVNHAGDEIDIPPEEAFRLIKEGSAVPVRNGPVETEIVKAPETARRRGRPRKVRDVPAENA